MLTNVCSHHTTDNNDNESKHLMTFCTQLVNHSQWKSVREFICGSIVEFPLYVIVSKQTEVSANMLDLDRMLYDDSCYALRRSVTSLETYTGDVIRIYTDDVHTGYARLIREKNETEVLLSDFYPICDDVKIHGPAVLKDYISYLQSTKYDLSDVSADLARSEKIVVSSVDSVLAIHSPFWPVEASEWITRRRSRGLPSRSVIKRIIGYGCDFVQVSHNRRRNDNEWRFSFSRAELFIIKSWTLSERIVYDALWVFNKRIASSNLCSYYFKTLMFWACEEKPIEFWQDDLLAQSVRELLIEMMKCVKLKVCVNYFIPGNNMMDHLIDTDLSREIDSLWEAAQSEQLILRVVDTCRRSELTHGNRIYDIESPAWIKRAFIIDQRVVNVYDNFTGLFRTDFETDLQNALYVELSDIYKGLQFQIKSRNSCDNTSGKRINFLKSESYLHMAVSLCKSDERGVICNCSEEFVQSMTLKYTACDISVPSKQNNNGSGLRWYGFSFTSDGHPVMNVANERKCLLYSRSFVESENLLFNNYIKKEASQSTNSIIAVCDVTDWKTNKSSGVEFYKEWLGQSPTVNISWFIARAYLANLYYTTQLDVSLTIRTCDDVIDVYRQSYMNKEFAERIFPVVLSTQLASIFDREIQELLGFYSLCYYVFDPSVTSVYLGVCPVLFAFYLLLRAGVDQGLDARAIFKCIDDYNDHMDVCDCDRKINTGSLILTKVIDLLNRKH